MSALASASSAALPAQGDVLAQAANENFTVASAILGRRCQQHLLAIYGFARLVDDVGDEFAGDRAELLEEIERELDRIYAGDTARHPVMAALAVTIAACRLPDSPLRRLIEANRRDQVVTRYRTFDELLGYCRLSAAPVGELVLHVFGLATADRVALSDRICAGLQIVEHLQDLEEDHARGRIYMPLEDMINFGCREDDLGAPEGRGRRGPLVAFEAGRARSLLRDGAPLARRLPLRPRIAVAGFVAGGRAALARLEHGYHGGGQAEPLRLKCALAAAFATAAVGR